MYRKRIKEAVWSCSEDRRFKGRKRKRNIIENIYNVSNIQAVLKEPFVDNVNLDVTDVVI